jgi:hypothetical protein
MLDKQNPTGAGGVEAGRAALSSTIYPTTEPHRFSIPILVNGREVGHVRGEVFHKKLCSSRGHLLRVPPAIAFDVRSLEDARRAGALRADVFDLDTGAHYHADVERIFEKGFRLNRGFGDQIALPLTGWVKVVGQ